MLADFEVALARGKLNRVREEAYSYRIEPKYDGVRQVLSNWHGIIEMTGRRTSTKTGAKLNKINHVPTLLRIMDTRWMEGTIIDGELMCSSLDDPTPILATSNEVVSILGSHERDAIQKQAERGSLVFVAFDIIAVQGTDIRSYSTITRRRILEDNVRDWPGAKPFITVAPQSWTYDWTGVEREYESLLDLGYEGAILKHNDAPYGDNKSWIKIKPTNTYDMVIVGYEQSESKTFSGNGIAALELALYGINTHAFHKVTKCSGMTHAWRREFYDKPEKYLLKVAEVEAQLMFPTGALRHPRFKKLRPDVLSSDQTFTKYKLEEPCAT